MWEKKETENYFFFKRQHVLRLSLTLGLIQMQVEGFMFYIICDHSTEWNYARYTAQFAVQNTWEFSRPGN